MSIEVVLENINNFGLYEWINFGAISLCYCLLIILIQVLRKYKKE